MATPDQINPATIANTGEARRDSTVNGKSLSRTVTDTITGACLPGQGLCSASARPGPAAGPRSSAGLPQDQTAGPAASGHGQPAPCSAQSDWQVSTSTP